MNWCAFPSVAVEGETEFSSVDHMKISPECVDEFVSREDSPQGLPGTTYDGWVKRTNGTEYLTICFGSVIARLNMAGCCVPAHLILAAVALPGLRASDVMRDLLLRNRRVDASKTMG